MTVRAEYLVVDTGGFIKNDLGGLHSMADHVVTLHEVRVSPVSDCIEDLLSFRWCLSCETKM